jgi:high-affinity nickel-transport protein
LTLAAASPLAARTQPTLLARAVPLFAALLAANAAVCLWALAVSHGQPVLLGAALLAYVLGLRHAVDADHIAAIDNVTRKLMQHGRQPLTVGLWFSLGHSTVVILACVGVAVLSSALRPELARFASVGSLLGTGVSAGFLFLIAAANLLTLRSVWRGAASADGAALQGGLLTRVLQPAMRVVSAPWRMYPLGFLFGLGFDTASEIALLGIASQASQHLSLPAMMILPALFTAGMCLVDTSDGLLMVGCYGWALATPSRRATYNAVMTVISILVALVIGVIELLELAAHGRSLSGPMWSAVDAANRHFGAVGVSIIALFIGSWSLSALIQRARRMAAARGGESSTASAH